MKLFLTLTVLAMLAVGAFSLAIKCQDSEKCQAASCGYWIPSKEAECVQYCDTQCLAKGGMTAEQIQQILGAVKSE